MKKIFLVSLAAIMSISGVFAASSMAHIPDQIKHETPSTPKPVHPPVKPIKGLIILGDNYAVDEDFVYVVNDAHSNWIKMPNADRVTFRVIGGQFARDADQIFQMGKKIDGVDMASFSLISGQYGYAQDKNHIYGPQGIIPDADTQTFKILTKDYALDGGSVYFDGKNVPHADSGSFEVIDHGLYAVDDTNVYYAGKVLENTSPDGFVVKGPRAFAADGRTFFEGQIEKKDPDGGIKNPTNVFSTSSPLKAFLAPYMSHFTGKNIPFWSLAALAYISIFSFLFVFFADRNDEIVPFWKTTVKTLMAIVVGIVGFWLASFFFSELISEIVGVIIGFFIFISFWSALGWIKSFLITILSLIAFVFLFSVVGMCLRLFFHDFAHFITYLDKPVVRMMGIMKIIGIFVGTWLISTQLNSSLFRSLGQALVATVISLLLLMFLLWIGTLGTLASIVIFTILYAVLLWIMRFRMVSNLFVETVRIIRIALIIGLLIALLVWVIL